MENKIFIESDTKRQVIDVTSDLTEIIRKESRNGIVYFQLPHTTAALIICEDDIELRADIVRITEKWLADLRPFMHIKNNNPNTEAHVLSALFGTTVVVPITKGMLELGTYQKILLLEMDGPKKREIRLKVIGSSIDE
ncbi:MAG: secondary thiamine-phosphate synthase enzyme YjbQ [Pelolinea sp.]|nr:secondary thiamine-phosphate synthase enzyme YjbQ [Pelolinea sp.]